MTLTARQGCYLVKITQLIEVIQAETKALMARLVFELALAEQQLKQPR